MKRTRTELTVFLMADQVLNSRILPNKFQRLLNSTTRKKDLRMRMMRTWALLPTFSSHGSLPMERLAARMKWFVKLTVPLRHITRSYL